MVPGNAHVGKENIHSVVARHFDVDQRRFKTPLEVAVDEERAAAKAKKNPWTDPF